MEEEYKLEDLKPIFKKIVKEEQKQHNIKIEGEIFTIKEYYKSDMLKNKLKLFPKKNIGSYLTAPLKFGGWYDVEDKRIVVIINPLYKLFDIVPSDSLAHIIRKIYHEIRHVYQTEKMFDTNIEKNFFIEIEKAIIKYETTYYRLYHDYFLIELDAENYSIEKTIQYLNKEKILDKKNESYINGIKESVEDHSKVYNKDSVFERFNYILQKKIEKNRNNSENPLIDSLDEITSNKELAKTLSLIYNQDGSFKRIKEIMNDSNKIDKNIISTIISSKAFMKNININELDADEIKYMIQALEITYQEELLKLETIKKVKEEDLTLIDATIHNEKKLMRKLKKILSLRSILMNMLLNKKRVEKDISIYDYIRKGKSK